MWAQMLAGPQSFEMIEVPDLRAGDLNPGQVLLATRAGAICGSDLPYFQGAHYPHPGNRGGLATRVPGFPLHEVVGEVIQSRHPAHRVGDTVVGWATGVDALAEMTISDGDGLAEFDPSLQPTAAVMLQPLACVLYAVERLSNVDGAHVAVVGQGPIGLLFSHVLKQRGAAHVIGVDRVDRSDVATHFGVDETVTAQSGFWAESLSNTRPAIVVEAIGHQVSTLKNCIDAVDFGGEIFYFGIPDDLVYPLDFMTFLRKNLTLHAGATIERRRMLREADSYLLNHPSLGDAFITNVYRANDAEAAYTAAIQPRTGQLKISIDLT